MAVKLRLRRMGKKKQPIYKVVAADARSPRDGKFLEAIGLYNPLTNPHTVNIKEDRALYWLSVGAQPTDTVKSLFTQNGILLKRELMSRGLSEEKIEAEMENWAKMREAKLKTSTDKKKQSKKAAAKEVEQPLAKTEEPKEEVEKPETKVEDSEIKTEETVVADAVPAVEEKVEMKEEPEKRVETEKTEIKEDNNDESTAEVKGAASEEDTKKKED